jgi:phosphoglycolate phosphatase
MSDRIPDAIVFDFDLTLADSRQGFIVCHEYAAVRTGLKPPDPDAVGRTIGTPLPLAFRQLYGLHDEEVAQKYIRLYQERADEVMTGLTVMLDGAAPAIRMLSGAGIKLAIVSQKLRYRVKDVLRREGLLESFALILGGEDVPAFKPDPRGILLALERLGSNPAETPYVGDTVIDAEAAARAGAPFIAVLTGYARAADFATYSPLAVLVSVRELPAHLGVPMLVKD